MDKEKLLVQFKYYHGEESCPEGVSELHKLWWDGEKSLAEACNNDCEFYERMQSMYEQALKERAVSGRLLDTTLPKTKRVIIFYLDLWHGKNFPFDDLDTINEY